MKSVIKEGNTSDKGFPKLMINPNTGTIVLFSEKEVGIIVYSEGPYDPVGYFCDNWIMTHFEDFNGTIELSND